MQESVTTVFIRDPFDPLGSRIIKTAEPGKQVNEYLLDFAKNQTIQDDYTLKVQLNDRFIEDFSIVAQENDYVFFCVVPKGDSIGSLLATIAIAVIAIYAPYALGIAAGSLKGTLLTAGVMMAGGLLVNTMFAPSFSNMGGDNGSKNYTWNLKENKAYENGTLPVLYGKFRVFPYLVGSYTTTDNEGSEYIHTLYALTDHELSNMGTTDNPLYVDGIEINDISIDSFPEVEYEVRKGSLTQAPLANWNEARNTKFIQSGSNGWRMTSDWFETTTEGNEINRLGLGFVAPRGFYYMNKKGDLREVRARIEVEYKKTSDSTWKELLFLYDDEDVVVDGRWSFGYWGRKEVQGGRGSTAWVKVWREVIAGGMNPDDYEEGQKIPYIELGLSKPPADKWETKNFIAHWLNNKTVTTTKSLAEIDSENEDPEGFKENIVVFAAASTDVVRRKWYTTELDGQSSYDIRVKVVRWERLNAKYKNYSTNKTVVDIDTWDEEPEGTRWSAGVFFESLEEITEGDQFKYPGTSLLAITALASDQLSDSRLRVSCEIERKYVDVYDPNQSKYVQKSASNPAWACYDILHNSNYGGNFDYNQIIYDDFEEWADWCDETIDDWVAGSWCSEGLVSYPEGAPKYEVNYYLDTDMTCKEACDAVGLLGRGSVVQYGNKFSCAVERPDPMPTQKFLFTVGNMIEDSFNEEFLPIEERANTVVVTYWDRNHDYEKQTVELTVRNSDEKENKTTIELPGCTRRDMAIRHGMFLILSSKYLTITASWEASVDSIHCFPGDIVEVQHDVPVWGYGGRIVSATIDSITLDRKVEMEAGENYEISIKYSDDSREYANVSSLSDDGYIVNVSSSLSKVPEEFDLYAFGKMNKVTKSMRIIETTRSDDSKRKITAIEHIPEVFDDCAQIPEYTPVSPLSLCEVLSIGYIEVWNDDKTEILGRVFWEGTGKEYSLYYRYYIEEDGVWSGWFFWMVTEANYVDIPGLPEGFQAEVAVACRKGLGQSKTIQFQYVGIVDGIPVGLKDIINPKIYFNLDKNGGVTYAAFTCELDTEADIVPDGIALFYSIEDMPNKLSTIWIGADTGLGYDLLGIHIKEEDIILLPPKDSPNAVDVINEVPVFPILTAVDAYTLRITNENEPISGEPGGGTFDGSFWVAVYSSTAGWSDWNKVSYYTETDLKFEEPFINMTSGEIMVPDISDVWTFAQLRWKDKREMEWRLAFIREINEQNEVIDQNVYEIVKHGGLSQHDFDSGREYFFLDKCLRAQEGTSKIDIGNPNKCELFYYPALGPNSNYQLIAAKDFVYIGERDSEGNPTEWKFGAETDLNINILQGMWGSMTCVAYKVSTRTADNPTGIVRSNIIPVSYGGGL